MSDQNPKVAGAPAREPRAGSNSDQEYEYEEVEEDLHGPAAAAVEREKVAGILRSAHTVQDLLSAATIANVVEAASPITGNAAAYCKPETRSWSLEGSLKLKNLAGYGDIWDASVAYGWDQASEDPSIYHTQSKLTRADRSSMAMADWASLPPELVQAIADCVLSTTGGVDAYMDMRAVCPSWRSSIAKPSPLNAVADLRFRPHHWVMVDMSFDNRDGDNTGLFLHVPTGRFRRLHLLELCDRTIVGATDGLLVLQDREPPHMACVFNPFTGDMLHFALPLPKHCKDNLAYTGGSHLKLFLLRWGCLFCVTPTSHVFTEKGFEDKGIGAYLTSLVNFQGNVYCADPDGCVYKVVVPAEQCDDEFLVIAQVSAKVAVSIEGDYHSYLVESAGELLLVHYVDQTFKVFRVDVEHKLLEEVKSLGRRALFLSDGRCVSINADKLPSVEGDCIYLRGLLYFDDDCVYNLRGGMVDIISKEYYLDRPLSLVQFLLRDFRSEL